MGNAKVARSRATVPRTAGPTETAKNQRARHDREAAESRTQNATAAAADAGDTTDATELPAATQQATPGNRSRAKHTAAPSKPGSTEVAHAEPQAGRQDGTGQGGHPAGEYDVTSPAPAAAVQATNAIDAHLQDVDMDRLKAILKDSVLDAAEVQPLLEACPVGFVLLKEGPERWRAHLTGTQRFGHGTTATQALEAYVMGTSSISLEDHAAREFLRLPKSQQQEIRDRDAAAAKATGGTNATIQAVEETRKTMAKRQGAALPAPGANTDAAEQMSASQATTEKEKKTAAAGSRGKRSAAKKK